MNRIKISKRYRTLRNSNISRVSKFIQGRAIRVSSHGSRGIGLLRKW